MYHSDRFSVDEKLLFAKIGVVENDVRRMDSDKINATNFLIIVPPSKSNVL